jgi:valyl-tRNA synthetase
MPFLTEEIWQNLRATGSASARDLSGWSGDLPDSIMIAPWPAATGVDEPAEREMELVITIIRAVRAVRSEYRVDPSKYISATIAAGPATEALKEGFEIISRLARLEPLQVHGAVTEKPKRAVAVIAGDVTVYLPLDELTDVFIERARLQKDLESADHARTALDRKLSDERFLARAPEHVVVRERERATFLADKAKRLRERLELLEE